MAKRLFLLLFMSLIGVNITPNFLAATDEVDLASVNYANAVETVPLPEPEPEPEPVYSYEPEVYYEPVYNESVGAPVAGAKPALLNYNVTIITERIVGDGLSYYGIYRTGKFIYAHNTANLLGGLNNMYVGQYFTISEGGVVKTYQVTDKVIYEKAANGYLNGSKKLTKEVEYNANGYSISMMTCYGTNYGNGDASHRLVIFADAV